MAEEGESRGQAEASRLQAKKWMVSRWNDPLRKARDGAVQFALGLSCVVRDVSPGRQATALWERRRKSAVTVRSGR